MIRTHDKSSFVGRFGRTWLRLRRTEIVCGACWTALVAAVCLGLLAAADYAWEWTWDFRAAGLAAAGLAVLLMASLGILQPMRWWSQP